LLLNVLILINNGSKYIHFFNKIGELMKKEGHNVIYAPESEFTEYKFKFSS